MTAEPSAQIDDAAQRAALHWARSIDSVEMLALSENAVFKVDSADAGRFVLRLHRPGYNTLSEMQSEVQWVAALRSVGVTTAVPRIALGGEHYVPVTVAGPVPADDQVYWAGAVDWIDGAPMEAALEADPSLTDSLYEQLGVIAGKIRAHSETWEVPDSFVRRHWNAVAFVGPDPLWGRFWESPALDPNQRDVLVAARDRLRSELGALSTDRSHYGMIHADFHLNNVMVDGDRAVAIDFDDAGFGWYAHEIAVALSAAHGAPGFDAAKESLVSGYRQVHALDDKELALVDTFITVRSLMTVGWLTARPEVKSYQHLADVISGAVVQAEHYLRTGS